MVIENIFEYKISTEKCPYASTLLNQFADHQGKIGTACDVCSEKECQHNKPDSSYAMNLRKDIKIT